MKRGTASKRLSLDLSIENNYPNFTRERGSYFFTFLSIMIRSNLTTSVNKDMISVKHVNTIMTISYFVIRHHLRFLLKRRITKGCVPSS